MYMVIRHVFFKLLQNIEINGVKLMFPPKKMFNINYCLFVFLHLSKRIRMYVNMLIELNVIRVKLLLIINILLFCLIFILDF
jgi:hypothetical protein